MKTPKPRYRFDKLLGPYESYLCATASGRAMRLADEKLLKFFSYFPDDMGLELFRTIHVAEYKQKRRSEGISEGAIAIEVNAVRQFFKWLIEIQKFPIYQPAQSYQWRPAKNLSGSDSQVDLL